MPNLMLFSSGNHEIELPLLHSLKLNQCNKMKYFSYGVLRTPMLERVEVNGSLCSLTEDLNAAIRREANRNGQPFTYADLEIASIQFDGKLSGGFTWIDKKTFGPSKPATGIAVAIRELNFEKELWLEQLQSETHFLKWLWHPNLVKLFGHCWQDQVLLEYMQRGSLDNYLFRENSASKTLSWNIRLKIAIGAARGLDFLHTLKKKVIHRDFKASNILLDDSYNAKISDLSLAILGPPDDESYVTTGVIGTYGYAAPEYVAKGHLYIKSDVYSFGVVLLELMTGFRAIDTNRPYEQINLVAWSRPFLSKKQKLRDIIDNRIEGQYSMKAMLLAAQLSLKCLESIPMSRPSMKEVVDALEHINAIEEKASRTLAEL